MPGPAPTAVGLRPVAAAFVTLAAPSDGVVVSHKAVIAAAPVVPNADAVAGARDVKAAVGVLHSDSHDAAAALATTPAAAPTVNTTEYNSTAS